jgi:hypothetical protein
VSESHKAGRPSQRGAEAGRGRNPHFAGGSHAITAGTPTLLREHGEKGGGTLARVHWLPCHRLGVAVGVRERRGSWTEKGGETLVRERRKLDGERGGTLAAMSPSRQWRFGERRGSWTDTIGGEGEGAPAGMHAPARAERCTHAFLSLPPVVAVVHPVRRISTSPAPPNPKVCNSVNARPPLLRAFAPPLPPQSMGNGVGCSLASSW